MKKNTFLASAKNTLKENFFHLLLFLLPFSVFSQTNDPNFSFDFNDQKIKENDNKIILRPVGVSLTYDRFGNKDHALYILGHAASYLNLGNTSLLKSPDISISLWVKMERKVYVGS